LRHDAPVPFFHFPDGKMRKDIFDTQRATP